MPRSLDYYLNKFSKLNISRHKERGDAPHKPVLLLSVLELIAQAKITSNEVRLSAELISSFLKYWGIIDSTQHNSDIALPFYHMRSEGFWHLHANRGFENTVKSRVRLRTLPALQDAVAYVSLDEELFQYCCDAKSRESLVRALVSKWFPGKAEEIARQFNVDSFGVWLDDYYETGGKIYSPEMLNDDKNEVRRKAFRRTIVAIYGARCAVCRMKANDHQECHIVDGAHIKPFHLFLNDRFDNGLCLCKNHHWAFDKGWIAIDDNYRLLVTRHIHEEVPDGKTLRDYAGHPILIPAVKAYTPRIEAIGWHREKVFLGE